MEYKAIGETSRQTRVLVEKVVAIMERRGMTRLELARRLSVRPSYITKLLSGRENMTVRTMEKMAEAIGCEVVFRPALRGAQRSAPPTIQRHLKTVFRW